MCFWCFFIFAVLDQNRTYTHTHTPQGIKHLLEYLFPWFKQRFFFKTNKKQQQQQSCTAVNEKALSSPDLIITLTQV